MNHEDAVTGAQQTHWLVEVPPPLPGAHCQHCGTGRMVGVYSVHGQPFVLDYRCAAQMLAAIETAREARELVPS